ncbi:MAG: 4-hydroxy-tetrahydrodipicolinate synthase [Limisphaerales bacterium]|jgi:4-hydroxy-tetrahydrodipicolinate synthase
MKDQKLLAFKGTGVAIITPFNAGGKIDYNALGKVINHVINGGLEYIVSLGTTGESAVMTTAEKHEVLRFTVKQVAGRVPIVAGFGGNDTKAVTESIEAFDKAYNFKGIDAILSVSPCYNKPTQEGIYQHFMAIDKVAPRPVILYNVPSRTGSNMEAETTLRLAQDGKNFFAIKEASGHFNQISKIIKDRPEGFLVLSGDDAISLPLLGLGMDGVISVVANGWPVEFSDLVRSGLSGNFANARLRHNSLLHIMELIFREGNPGGIKCAMAEMGLIEEELRLPGWPVSDSLRAAIKAEVAKLIKN